MTQLNEIYKCNICGNITEVLHTGIGQLVCCGKPMELKQEKTENKKHVPIIEKIDNGFKIKIGVVEHPMEETHHIEWIEIIANDKIYKKYLKPGQKPEANFYIKADNIKSKAYCNVHGLWKA